MKELKEVIGFLVVVLFKYVSLVGVVVVVEMNDMLKKIYFVDDMEFFLMVIVYVCVWGVDWMLLYGDFIVFFDICDELIVWIINCEVLDGVIVFGYILEVFEILRNKCKGIYNVIKIDLVYCLVFIEYKDVFGIIFE